MYIECKAGNLTGKANIGRVIFSRSGKSIRYKRHIFQSLKGEGFKSNYVYIEASEDNWISGPRKDDTDRLYSEGDPV